jgi:uncharacterized membrane protein
MRLFEARTEEFKEALYKELDKRLQSISEILEKRGSIVPMAGKWTNISFVSLNIFLVAMAIVIWLEPTMIWAVFTMVVVYASLLVFVLVLEKWEREAYKMW